MTLTLKPWLLDELFAAATEKQEAKLLPPQQAKIAVQTSAYEQRIRKLWEEAKPALLAGVLTVEEFSDQMAAVAGETWPAAIADILGITEDDLSDLQRRTIEDEIETNTGYIRDSLAPDLAKALAADVVDISNFDFRTIFMYAGALWSLGSLATVMFDGLSVRDLADLFIFLGPDDLSTCTGDRGCDNYVNKVYTVAQILAEDIVPGHLRCVHNCRHILVPIVSPLREQRKHQPGRHDQLTHGHAQGIGTPVTIEWLRSKEPPLLHNLVVGQAAMIEETLVDFGVTQEELEGVKYFTNDAPLGWVLEKTPKGGVYLRDPLDLPGEYVSGAYDPSTKIIHLSPALGLYEPGAAVILHELGHSVVDGIHTPAESGGLRYRAAFVKSRMLYLESGGRGAAVAEEQLAKYGLRSYSLSHADEFLADTYMTMKAGNDTQRLNLARLYNEMGFESLEDVFKEETVTAPMQVLELQSRISSRGVIKTVLIPVVVLPAQVLQTPWFYSLPAMQKAEKHQPGRHSQLTHGHEQGRAAVDSIVPDISRTANYARVKPFMDTYLKKLAATYGISPEEYISRFENVLRKELEDSTIKVRMSKSALVKVLDDEKPKNTFETSSTSAEYRKAGLKYEQYVAERKITEGEMFGKNQHPIYGCLSKKDDTASAWVTGYGDVMVVLKSDVKSRATFTDADSLDYGRGSRFIPSPVNDPKYFSSLFLTNYSDPLAVWSRKGGIDHAGVNAAYVEAQIFGDVKLSDIDRVVFTGKKAPSTTTVKRLEAKGIKWEQ